MIVPVILSGGSGTRLWPLSRDSAPKQFHRLIGSETMVQLTAARLERLHGVSRPIVVCNARHLDQVESQLAQVDPLVILEPAGRNTAPAVGAACHVARRLDPDAIVVVLPSDHLIQDVDAFADVVRQATDLATEGHLVTFGIVPTGPVTGYGYIKPGASLASGAAIDSFVEKPDADTAQRYVDDGYLWNSGMFAFRADRYLAELALHAPEIATHTKAAVASSARSGDIIALDADAWATSPSDSIDYAVMEHTDHGVVLPLDAGWNDIGSWAALYDVSPADSNGNVMVGDVLAPGTRGSYVRSTGRPIVVLGLDDVVVVETADAVLVTRRDRAEDVKLIGEHFRTRHA